jgi:hypothetical protein
MSFQHIWPSGPGMLESLKEIAVVRKHHDGSNMKMHSERIIPLRERDLASELQ